MVSYDRINTVVITNMCGARLILLQNVNFKKMSGSYSLSPPEEISFHNVLEAGMATFSNQA